MQNLTLLSQEALLSYAKRLVEEDRNLSLLIIECLRECERRMLYAEMGYSSLWDFAVKYLGLSEASAQLRISAMRLVRDHPEVLSSLQSGELSLTNAAQVQSFFRNEKKLGKAYSQEAKQELIQSMSGLSKKQCVQKLFSISPEALPQERVRTVSETKSELRVVLDHSVMLKLERLKALLAHQFPQANYADLIEYSVDEALVKIEKKKRGKSDQGVRASGGVEKSDNVSGNTKKASAESVSDHGGSARGMSQASLITDSIIAEGVTTEKRSQQEGGVGQVRNELNKEESSTSSGSISKEKDSAAKVLLRPAKVNQSVWKKSPERPYIPVRDRQWVWNRSGGQCEFRSKVGIRCESRYGLELDHAIPVAMGGKSDRDSLRYLCRNHNIQQAQEKLGTHVMEKFVPSLKKQDFEGKSNLSQHRATNKIMNKAMNKAEDVLC